MTRPTLSRDRLNTPLGDNLALRINGVYNKSDGWLEDAATGQDLMPEENWAGRAALRWELSEKTSATLSWDHDDLDQLARPAIGILPVQAGQTRIPFPARFCASERVKAVKDRIRADFIEADHQPPSGVTGTNRPFCPSSEARHSRWVVGVSPCTSHMATWPPGIGQALCPPVTPSGRSA